MTTPESRLDNTTIAVPGRLGYLRLRTTQDTEIAPIESIKQSNRVETPDAIDDANAGGVTPAWLRACIADSADGDRSSRDCHGRGTMWRVSERRGIPVVPIGLPECSLC